MKKKEKKAKKGAPPWMTSYGDMTTLLLTFFILMFNIAEISAKDFYLVLSSFRGALGIFSGGLTLSHGRLEELGMNLMQLPAQTKGKALSKSLRDAVETFKPEIQSKRVRVSEDERGLVISLSGDAFFAPGSARLLEDSRVILQKVARIMNSIPNYARIEGHTDNRPIPIEGVKEGYETNWELSSARGVNVLRYLAENEGVGARRLSSVAFGQFRPIDDNDIPEGRAYNRRVDIVILREKPMSDAKRKVLDTPLPDEEWR